MSKVFLADFRLGISFTHTHPIACAREGEADPVHLGLMHFPLTKTRVSVCVDDGCVSMKSKSTPEPKCYTSIKLFSFVIAPRKFPPLSELYTCRSAHAICRGIPGICPQAWNASVTLLDYKTKTARDRTFTSRSERPFLGSKRMDTEDELVAQTNIRFLRSLGKPCTW
jgi:hypothetical protein